MAKTTEKRDAKGHFTAGNTGGPGRPRKPLLSSKDLSVLAHRPSAYELRLQAMLLQDQEDAIAYVEANFPAAIAARVRRTLTLADAAEALLSRLLAADAGR